jgi:hypothetical protein
MEKLYAALISAAVAFIILALNFFIIEPRKEKRNLRKEKLKNLYAPLYILLISQSKLAKSYNPQKSHMLFYYVKEEDKLMLSRTAIHKLVFAQIGYASNEFIELWTKYSSTIPQKDENLHPLAVLAIKEYNQLKKDLNLPYDEQELKTGIPEHYKELRETST